MEKIGIIYQAWEPGTSEATHRGELAALKVLLRRDGFRWSESSADSKLHIHDGGDILSDDKYKVGELEGNKIFVYGSSRLEKFLENYNNI